MKYIRTTKSIYSGIQLTKNTILVNGKKNNRKYPVSLNNKNVIIDKADTIEELCDMFTYEYDKNLKHVRCWKDTYTGKWYDCDTDVLLNEKEKSTIKGAIWTDKGLIYVAKMNENGELVLI